MANYAGRRSRFVNAGLGLGLISFASVFIIMPFAAGIIFLILAGVATANGIIGYVGGRRRSILIPILGPTLLIVASHVWNAMHNPYGWPRSGPPGYSSLGLRAIGRSEIRRRSALALLESSGNRPFHSLALRARTGIFQQSIAGEAMLLISASLCARTA